MLAVLDVTERKRTEEELLNADRRKEGFLALLAHELRNPLAPIRTGLELMRLSGDTPPSIRSVRSMMERQVGQMVRLIDDLLDVRRIASGKIVLQRAPTSLTELLQTSNRSPPAYDRAAGIELTVECPSQACVVDVDPTRFVQSSRTYSTMRRSSRRAEVRIHVGRARRVGDVDGNRHDCRHGRGHFQGHAAEGIRHVHAGGCRRERVHGGLGIGLALARRLGAARRSRSLHTVSGPGRGSAFSITLPVCDSPAAGLSGGGLDIPQLSCRVVIVDDNRDAAEMMAMLVDRDGGNRSDSA